MMPHNYDHCKSGNCEVSGRALRKRNGFSASKKRITRTPIIKPCLLQTFIETYSCPCYSEGRSGTRASSSRTYGPSPPEKSRLLSQIPLLGKSATDRHALLPTFVESGIEGWLDQFDRSIIYSQLSQRPAAGKKSTPQSYASLAKAGLILLGEDMHVLSESDKYSQLNEVLIWTYGVS